MRKETSPEDVKGMYSAEGVLCQLGGMTSHAAVVARGWGKPCVTGVQGLAVSSPPSLFPVPLPPLCLQPLALLACAAVVCIHPRWLKPDRPRQLAASPCSRSAPAHTRTLPAWRMPAAHPHLRVDKLSNVVYWRALTHTHNTRTHIRVHARTHKRAPAPHSAPASPPRPLQVDERNKVARIGSQQIREGDFISLNGTTGEIILGKQALSPPDLTGDLARFMGWVDGARKLRVFTNCDTPADAKEVGRRRVRSRAGGSPAKESRKRRLHCMWGAGGQGTLPFIHDWSAAAGLQPIPEARRAPVQPCVRAPLSEGDAKPHRRKAPYSGPCTMWTVRQHEQPGSQAAAAQAGAGSAFATLPRMRVAPAGSQVRRGGHRAVPHGAHVLRI